MCSLPELVCLGLIMYIPVTTVCMYMQQYLKLRSNAVAALKKTGPHPYPHKFHVSVSLTSFIEQYQGLGDGEHHTDVVSVAGDTLLSLTHSLILSHTHTYYSLFHSTFLNLSLSHIHTLALTISLTLNSSSLTYSLTDPLCLLLTVSVSNCCFQVESTPRESQVPN